MRTSMYVRSILNAEQGTARLQGELARSSLSHYHMTSSLSWPPGPLHDTNVRSRRSDPDSLAERPRCRWYIIEEQRTNLHVTGRIQREVLDIRLSEAIFAVSSLRLYFQKPFKSDVY